MKTSYILTASLLLSLTLNSYADDRTKSHNKSVSVSAAPFVWGSPEVEIPIELAWVKAVNLKVPVAPFVWGDPEDAATLNLGNLIIPAAPFVYGNPEDEAPVELSFTKATGTSVPVAPFVWGNADTDVPAAIVIR